MSKSKRSTKHSIVKPAKVWPLLPGQEMPVADAAGLDAELDGGVTVETTVVVATGEELGEGVTVDVRTWVVVEVATGDGLDEDGTGVKMEDELDEGVTTDTTVVVATGDALGDEDDTGTGI